MKLLKEINDANPHVRENPIISFNAFGDFSLGILFIYYIHSGEDILGVQSEMNMEILKQFNANGLDFAFPTQTIQAEILKS